MDDRLIDTEDAITTGDAIAGTKATTAAEAITNGEAITTEAPLAITPPSSPSEEDANDETIARLASGGVSEEAESASRPGAPAVAAASASTVPIPPASDAVLPTGSGDAVTDEVRETLGVCKSIEAEGSNIVVATALEKDTAITPDTPVQAKKRQERRDMFAAVLKAKGIDDATVAELTVQREITVGRQRQHPTWCTVCSPQMIAFFATRVEQDGTVVERTDEDLEADALKHVRRDGGKLGPVARYKQLIEEASSSAPAAAAINDHVGQRIRAIRIYLVSVINELRRRRAVRAGVDPKTIQYLTVSEMKEAA